MSALVVDEKVGSAVCGTSGVDTELMLVWQCASTTRTTSHRLAGKICLFLSNHRRSTILPGCDFIEV